ncbi:glycosyltransferase family 4 protein [Patescibacteria group bacterium]|nr:glycosyltransferase family 4 protein [Patescibacteria group bacterium]
MKKKLKVAVLIDAWFPFYGGGQVHVRELTKRLSVDCRFKLYHPNSTNILLRFLWALTVIPQLLRDYSTERFDLIHAHAYIAGFPGKVISKILHIPVVYTVHGSNVLDLRELTRSNPALDIKIPIWKYALEKWLLTGIRYDHQITVGSKYLTHKNVNKNISVIPNGVDTKEFDKLKETKRKQFTLIFVGRDDPMKGIQFLDGAMNLIHQKHPQIKLVKIKTGKIQGRKLVKEYKSSHVFILPSLSEGHPLTLLEAWAAELPVIVTSVGDNPKMVKKGVNGYLVPAADEESLAQAILDAYRNPNLERLGKAGYNLVKKKYTWEKAAKATLKVYKEVIHGVR